MTKPHRFGIWICITLWFAALLFTALAASSQIPGVSEVVKIADIAREKDVVWLSLMTTIVAVLFSAWLVWRKDKQTDAVTQAHLESAKAIQQLSISISELRNDLAEKNQHHQ